MALARGQSNQGGDVRSANRGYAYRNGQREDLGPTPRTTEQRVRLAAEISRSVVYGHSLKIRRLLLGKMSLVVGR